MLVKFKHIRPRYCKCLPDKVCYECVRYSKFNGSKYLITWNKAVRAHNKEVRCGKPTRER